MFSEEQIRASAKIIALVSQKNMTISTAESCTGGLLGGLLTSVSGSSKVFIGGLIAYSNEIKESYLKIPANVLKEHGAVSYEIAELMSTNIRDLMKSDLGVGVTGMAENSNLSSKDAGLVYVSVCGINRVETRKFNFSGNRQEVRIKTLEKSLEMLAYVTDG